MGILVLLLGPPEDSDPIYMEISLSWPYFPFLPLYNTKTREVGVLVDLKLMYQKSGFETTVFLCNLCEIGCHRHYDTHEKLIQECSRVDYPSMDQLKEAGWVPG